MAYNPDLYWPNPNFQPFSRNSPVNSCQSVNGLVRVESVEGAQMYQLPPGSVSPPLMLASDNVFFIKTTDDGGAATIKAYRFEEIPLQSGSPEYITKDYFDEWANKIMEVIDGKHSVSESAESSK